MANENIYQSDFTGQQMDERFRAVATLAEALTAVEQAILAKYTKPAGGIPATDLDADVNAALAKANSAVQSLADYYTKSEVDVMVAAVNAQEYVDVTTLPAASADTLGKIYLVGPTSGEYARYITTVNGSTYGWVQIGTTEISMANYATKAELSQLEQIVDNTLELETEVENIDITPAQWTHGYYTGNLDEITAPTGTYWSALFDCMGVNYFTVSGKIGSNNYRVFDANGDEIKNGTSAYYTNAINGDFVPPSNATKFQVVFSDGWDSTGANIRVSKNVNKTKSVRLDRIEAGITTPSEDLWTPTMKNGYYSAAGVATTDNNFDSCQYPLRNGYTYQVTPQVTNSGNNTRLYRVESNVYTQVTSWKTNDPFDFVCPSSGDYVLQVVRDKQYPNRWPHLYEMEFAAEVLPDFDKFKYSTLLFEGIVHRGYNEIAPENTLVAFALAKTALYAKFVEADIEFTSDDVPVLLHDSTINRTARNADGTAISGTVNIADITYEQALTYDFGIWKGQEYAGTKIPTLDEFLQLCKVLGLVPLIELKDDVTWTSERVAIIAASIKRVGMQKAIRFGSFSPTVLGSISAYFPNARLVLAPFSVISGGKYTSAVISQLLDDADSLAAAHNNEVVLSTHYGYMSTDIYNTIAARGYNTYSWTINDATLLADLDPNIVGVMSDNFDAARYMVDNLLESLT